VRRRRDDQLLVRTQKLERLLTSLANNEVAPMSSENVVSVAATLHTESAFARGRSQMLRSWQKAVRLQAQTQKYWPELWERRGDESTETTNGRAVALLRRVTRYLRKFWETQDPRVREWTIYRLREWYWLDRIHRLRPDIAEFSGKRKAAETNKFHDLNAAIDDALDAVPERSAFEDSLFHLQKIEHKALQCPNPQCLAPYFIASKKSQKFCSPECARPTLLASKRNYWKNHRRRNER
jgi:hypothetical protein